MTRDEFSELVARLEQRVAANPRAYKTQVLALGVLGYGYVLLLVLLSVALTLVIFAIGLESPLVALKLGVPLLAFVYMLLRALWVRLEVPTGVELNRTEQPGLFKILDKIRRKQRGPRLHQVLLTNDFNASIIQIPRLGLLGWQKNYLMIGLPLMQALSPKQFAAVLAHEYGHLSGAHGRSGAWIYRIRQTWFRLMQALDAKPHWGQALLRRFFDWYAPYFAAYSFVLARQEEYEADRQAARISGTREAADALLNVSLKGRYLQQTFWPSLYAQASNLPRPAMSPFMDMGKLLHQDGDLKNAEAWLQQALARDTDSEDTHPCLRDRIHALGETARVPEAVKTTAASYFFAEGLPDLANQFSEAWRNEVLSDWTERYEEASEARKRIAELAAQPAMSVGEAYEYARLNEAYNEETDPLPLFEAVVKLQSDHAQAIFSIGRLMLARGDESGIKRIKQAMQMAPGAVLPGCEILYNHYLTQGNAVEAQAYADRYHQQIEHERECGKERNTLNYNDKLIKHDLTADKVSQLIAQLKRYRRIGKIYLARKQIKLSEQPLYVMGLRYTWWWWDREGESASQFVDRVLADLKLDYEAYVVVLDKQAHSLYKSLKKLPNALVYER